MNKDNRESKEEREEGGRGKGKGEREGEGKKGEGSSYLRKCFLRKSKLFFLPRSLSHSSVCSIMHARRCSREGKGEGEEGEEEKEGVVNSHGLPKLALPIMIPSRPKRFAFAFASSSDAIYYFHQRIEEERRCQMKEEVERRGRERVLWISPLAISSVGLPLLLASLTISTALPTTFSSQCAGTADCCVVYQIQ